MTFLNISIPMSIMYRSQQSEVVKTVTGPAMYRQDSKTKTTKRKATQNKTHHNTTPPQKNLQQHKNNAKHGKAKGNTKHNTNQTNTKQIKPQNKSKTNHKSNRNKTTTKKREATTLSISCQLLHNSYTSM